MSPHVSIYQWRRTIFNPSILHRAVGLILTLGLVLLTYFLVSVASGPESYGRAVATLASPWFYVVYVALAWAFSFHLVAGIRHLIMDMGVGFERRASRASTVGLFIASTLLTLAVCWWLAARLGIL